ncbi:16099_t:CDS:2 [Dentiscutata heterogama]|uniref:16099_t:CDS:1 n=1 Tax=Dentiscutata heterogama TaxID=1316150 RepID=A0ACA9L010_9GLOM|nr:16099_t:CDS:2 [Dentiscutata heterogama]
METLQTLTKDTVNGESYGERIILNVGGIKYETYVSTLLAYPTTLLGTMFQERNKALLKPINGNEYFIDRDGLDPIITRQDLEDECDYFQVPRNSIINAPIVSLHSISPIRRLVADKLDSFVKTLETIVINTASTMLKHHFRGFKSTVTITFAQESYIGGMTSVVIRPKNDTLTRSTWKLMQHHGAMGYFLLDQFGEKIGNYLTHSMPEVSWELNHKIYAIAIAHTLLVLLFVLCNAYFDHAVEVDRDYSNILRYPWQVFRLKLLLDFKILISNVLPG